MNLMCMFCDNLDDVPETKELVSVDVMLSIPAMTRERLIDVAIPTKLVGTICDKEIYRIPTDIADIDFYINDMNKIALYDTPYLKVSMLVYGNNILRIKRISKIQEGRMIVELNINTLLTPVSPGSEIHVAEISSVTMHSHETPTSLPDPLRIEA